jgi:non-ribosomal peptide synthetase component E (peptide arylation enzyme)
VISHHQQTILTYDALDRDSNKLARGLQKLGVKKGERVAVSLGNNVEFATVGHDAIMACVLDTDLQPRLHTHCSSSGRY